MTTSEDLESLRSNSISLSEEGSIKSSGGLSSSEEVEEIQMYFQGSWYLLYAYEESHHDIDAQVLVDQMFQPILQMVYPESEKNMVYGKRISASNLL